MDNVTRLMFATLAKLLYATSHNERLLAALVPQLWETPAMADLEQDADGNFWWGDIRVFFPSWGDRIPVGQVPVEPRDAFTWAAQAWGDVVCVGKTTGDDDRCPLQLISPTLARHLGTAEGGQLNLYAAVMYQFLQICQSPADDDVWEGEWKQWWSSHSTAIFDAMIGGELEREQAKSGMLAKTARGKGVYSAKVGAWLFNVEDVNGVRHLSKPGEVYVPTSSPLAKLDGMTVVPWRNPMPFLDFCAVKAIGPATKVCPQPSIEVEEQILPDSKLFAHPFQVSKTAGDVDGDSWQFLCIDKLLAWATKPKNKPAIDEVPGLWEGLLECFLEEE